MPYAFYGRVSTSPIAGGISISDSQYAEAISAMTDRDSPEQVSISGGTFALVSPSLPIEITLSLDTATTLPAVDGGSRVPVNTGLARHPDGGWIVGDDGRVPFGSTFDAGLIHYDDEWVQLERISWAGLGVGDDKFSCQGVAVDILDNSVYGVAKDTDGTGSVAVQVSLEDWSLIRQVGIPNETNGLAIDTDQRQFLILREGGLLERRSMADGSLIYAYPRVIMPSADMLYYLGAGKLLVTYGPNGAPGIMEYWDVSTGGIIALYRFTMGGADAIEGVVVHDERLYLNNDANFHAGSPDLNRVLEYDVEGLF